MNAVVNNTSADVGAQIDASSVPDLWAEAQPLLEEYAIPAVGMLLMVIVAYMVAKFVARLVSSPVQKRVDETLGKFVGKLVYYAIMVSVLVAVMGKFGLEVASFAAILAAAGFAIGMAFQGTLGNFASGIMLLVFRPFKVGDVVSAAGITAKVNEIDLFTTIFDTPDNRRIIVPNSSITGSTIENISHHSERRVEVEVGCDYGADLRETREVLERAAESLQNLLVVGDGRGYQVILGTLGDSAVNWKVRFWTRSENFWPVTEALTEAVKNHLDDADIGIPFPQMDLHIPDAALNIAQSKAA